MTGSRIKKKGLEQQNSISPIKIMDSEEIEAESTPALGEIITNLPFNYGSDAFSFKATIAWPPS